MEFSRQEYRSGLPFPSPGDLPDPGIEPRSPALQADSLPSESPGKPQLITSQILGYYLLEFFMMGIISLIFKPLFTAKSIPDCCRWDLYFAGVETAYAYAKGQFYINMYKMKQFYVLTFHYPKLYNSSHIFL